MSRSARAVRTAGRLRRPAWSGIWSTSTPSEPRAAAFEREAREPQRTRTSDWEPGALAAERTSCEVSGMRR